MEIKDIKRVLRNPCKELVELALSYVNLTDKEKQVIEYCELQDKTEEQTAELMDISVRNVCYIKREYRNKLSKVWNNNFVVSLMLKG